ncbi:MAG: hypothetical protein AAF335_04955, partial [Bacteroidota bacterium]
VFEDDSNSIRRQFFKNVFGAEKLLNRNINLPEIDEEDLKDIILLKENGILKDEHTVKSWKKTKKIKKGMRDLLLSKDKEDVEVFCGILKTFNLKEWCLKQEFGEKNVKRGKILSNSVSWEAANTKCANLLVKKNIIQAKSLSLPVKKVFELLERVRNRAKAETPIPLMLSPGDLSQPSATNRRRVLNTVFGQKNVKNDGKITGEDVDWVKLLEEKKVGKRVLPLIWKNVIKIEDIEFTEDRMLALLNNNEEKFVHRFVRMSNIFFIYSKLKLLKAVFGEEKVGLKKKKVNGKLRKIPDIKSDDIDWNNIDKKELAEKLVDIATKYEDNYPVEEKDFELEITTISELLEQDKALFIPFIQKKGSMNRNKLLRHAYGSSNVKNDGTIEKDKIKWGDIRVHTLHLLLKRNDIITDEEVKPSIGNLVNERPKDKRILKRIFDYFPGTETEYLKQVYGEAVEDDGTIRKEDIVWNEAMVTASKYLIDKTVIKVDHIAPSTNKILEILKTDEGPKIVKKMFKQFKGLENRFLQDIFEGSVAKNGKIVNKDKIAWGEKALNNTSALVEKNIITLAEVKPSPKRILELLENNKKGKVDKILRIFGDIEMSLFEHIFGSTNILEDGGIRGDKVKWKPKTLKKTELLVGNNYITAKDIDFTKAGMLDLLINDSKNKKLKKKDKGKILKKIFQLFPTKKTQLLKETFGKENVTPGNQIINLDKIPWDTIDPKEVKLLLKTGII